ncbi:MAG: XamI family restriction endonuclease [Luteimonas sp.]|nr:XamI family restriction endonuclease [Luteimonas sp.]
MTAKPRQWTLEDLQVDVAKATALFRESRIGEPLSIWKTTFFQKRRQVRQTFNALNFRNPARVHSRQIHAMHEKGLGGVLRYLAAPPISDDDLKTLSDSTLSLKALRQPSHAKGVLRTLRASLDPIRFPWISSGVKPHAGEWRAAITATAALMTAQAVATQRRHAGKNEQERATKAYLQDILGLTEVAPRPIRTFRDVPPAGSFCGESEVWGEKADIVVSLFDDRLLLIECKVSNSSVNSFKRVVHEAAGKATAWTSKLGTAHAVPAAVLSGVFRPQNLLLAQDKGLSLFWAHRLDDLGDFINMTRATS